MSDIAHLKEKNSERQQEEAARFQNAMQMQQAFFALRERFFVLFTDKFPMGLQDENFMLAHQAASLDFIRRCDDSKVLMDKIGARMEMPALYSMLRGDA